MLRRIGIRAEQRSFSMAKQQRNPPLTENEILCQTMADLTMQLQQLTTFINVSLLRQAVPVKEKIDTAKETYTDGINDDDDNVLEEDEEFFSEHLVNPSYCLFGEDNLKGAEYSFVDQIGDPIFDVYDEHDTYDVPISEVVIKNNEDFCGDLMGDDGFDVEVSPVFDVFDEDDVIDNDDFFEEHIYNDDASYATDEQKNKGLTRVKGIDHANSLDFFPTIWRNKRSFPCEINGEPPDPGRREVLVLHDEINFDTVHCNKMPNHDQQANPFCSCEEDLDGEIYKYLMSDSYYDEAPCYETLWAKAISPYHSRFRKHQLELVSGWRQPCAMLSSDLLVSNMFGFGSQTLRTIQWFSDMDVFYEVVVFSFCSILVPIVTDLKVIQFVCVLAPAAQIIIFRCEEADFISTVLLSNDSPCTWLEHKECTSVYASATNLVWGLECLSFKFMCDQTSLYRGMGLFRSDLCCTSMASVFFNANISRQVLLPWQFHTAGKYAEMSSTREHRLWHPQQATHIVLLWLGLEAVIGFFDDIHINGVMPEALISLHSQILPLLQHEIMFLDELECNIDIYWRVCLHMLILFVQCSMAEQQFLCGDVVGRLMLDRGVLIAFLFNEKGKTKYLWRPWVYEFFMVLLQTFSVEWQFILFYWRVGDVAQELDCYSNGACESNNVLCILVSNIVPKPVWKCMSLSTAGKKVVMVFSYKILICGFSLAAPFTSPYQALNLLYCTTLLVLKQECEVAIGNLERDEVTVVFSGATV
ncbi:hypothetical protein F2Q68_00041555 [Brassica cretica]|uniref:Uncharacterized protein n=1 Tax=Brassica cretica TaxID=69181 RepID=A0A8S9MRL1_BRACR|nr:hypothetical protein F2Q68_00041555 [Brassica cretica]